MNLAKFLGSGTTYAHTSKSSVLSKVATAIVASLALAAGVQAADRASLVTELQPPRDMISTFYQNLAAPGSRNLVIVSSLSADMNRMLASMPPSFAKLYEAQASAAHTTADAAGFMKAMQHSAEEAFNYRLSGRAIIGDQQTLCFVNAAEAVNERVHNTPRGQSYVVMEQNRALPTLHSADDAMYFSTLHELYHCAASQQFAYAGKQAFGPDGEYYGMAVDEMLADLAVVLNYAAADGSFYNGMATIRGMRATALADIEHNTEDMLDYVLERLDASQFQGKQSGEIMAMVNDIAHELNPLHNQELKDLYSVSAVEKVALANRMFGDNEALSKKTVEVAKAIHGKLDAVMPKARAMKLIDAVVTLNVKNASLHRELGMEGFKQVGLISKALHVELPVYQQARAAVFDASISDGLSTTSPWMADAQLKAGNRFTPLFVEHVQRMEQQQGQQSKPTLGMR
ncbi:hypothetical protein L4Z64_001297 [Pseudomonas aeruginosa]|nr:hypothetical protein [Pseudomonas aeruginosa]